MSEQIVKRKPGEPIDEATVREVLELLRNGVRVAEITGKLGVSTFTVYRLKKAKIASGELGPRSTAGLMSTPFIAPDELAETIQRLEARGAIYEASDDPSQRARAQLCRELARGLQNSAARAQVVGGRRAPVRSKRRKSDIVLSLGAAA